jgi:hypothetical protein
MRTDAVVTAGLVLRRPAFFLTAGILFLGGVMISGCSSDKDGNPAGAAPERSFSELFKAVDEDPPANPAPKQPLAAADAKENFHIYLAFGQSNMEGQNPNYASDFTGDAAKKYKQNVNPRFRVMTAVAGSYKLASGSENRKQGEWYTAVPPLIRNNLGLSPADYFGRTLVDGIPDTNIKIGIIAVAVAGCAIEGLEKGNGANTYYSTTQDFMKQIAKNYDNNPYNRLVTLAKEAQKAGVIKGIIMHQGESGSTSNSATVWAQKVKGIYDNLLSDLGLPANSIPFLAGEPVTANESKKPNNAPLIRGLTNTMTAKLPGGEPVAYVISSKDCTHMGDTLHFSYDGYEKLGKRYGEKMLELNYKNQSPPTSIKNVTSRPD